MSFVPSVTSCNTSEETSSHRFIFSGNSLLVSGRDHSASLPEEKYFPRDSYEDTVFFGYLNRSPCYSCTVKENAHPGMNM